MGHFASSPRERKKRDRRDSRGDEIVEEMKERDRDERKMNESKKQNK